MHTKFSLVRFCWVIWAVGLVAPAAWGLEVATQVEQVVVYTQGATVTRTARVKLSAGSHQLQLPGLPGNIRADQIQIAVSGQGLQVGQVKTEVVQSTEAFNARVQALQAQIDAVQLQLKGLDDSNATAQLELRFLDGIAQGYAKESWYESARGEANIGSWREALNVLRNGSAVARKTLLDNSVSAQTLGKELSRLQREMQVLNGARPSSMLASLSVQVNQAQTVGVAITYQQDNARWYPRYEARLDSDASRLTIIQKALVEQHTDEAWTDVQLTLADSQPSGELLPPVLTSLVVDLQDPSELIRRKSRSTLEEVVVTAQFSGAPMADAQPPAPVVDVSNYGVTYQIPGRVSIGNERDDEHLFELSSFANQVELITRIYPEQSLTAFLQARFEYDQAAPMAASEMAVYVDSTFIGNTAMPAALPGQQLYLPVGQDRRMQITVRDQAGMQGQGGIISRRNEQLTDKLFEITNRHTDAVLVEVVGRYPVAANEDIEVSIPRAATSPSQTDLDDVEGVVVWRKRLAADETWRIQHQYQLTYPAKMRLIER